MTGPEDPQYPDPQYPSQNPQPYPPQQYPQPYPPQQYPPAPGSPPVASPGLASRLGDRAMRRPQPRLGVSLAGAGIGLMIVGIVVWGGDYASSGSGGVGNGGGSHRFLGVLLALLVVVAGYALAIRMVRGPLATAGAVAGAIGVPVVLGFLTLGESSDGFPLSLDALAIVSVLVWVASYLFVPGLRGHSFLLGFAAVLFWFYIVLKVEPHLFSLAFFSPALAELNGESGAALPDYSSVAAVSIVLALVYYGVAFGLDQAGRSGTGTPFVVAAVPALDLGVSLASRSLHEVGTGILTIVLGLVIGAGAARFGRRFTTWVSVSGAAFGAALIVIHLVGDNAAGGGIALVLVGAVAVATGVGATRLLSEPDDMALPDVVGSG